MSSSDWSSEMEIDINEIRENAAIRIVKSSTQAQFLTTLNRPQPPPQLIIPLHPSSSRLPTSYTPQLSLSSFPKTPIKLTSSSRINEIFEDIKSPPQKLTDINERFVKFREKVKAKIEKLSQDQEDIQKKNCTFKPQILNNKKSARNFNEYLCEIKHLERNKEERIKSLRYLKGGGGLTHAPEICKQSMKIAKKRKDGQNVYQKLYSERKAVNAKREKTKAEPLPSFSPTVNPKSHEMKREGSANQILYEDALRRQNQRSESPSYIKEKFISVKSEQVLSEKFTKEFQGALLTLFNAEKIMFTFSEFVSILCEMFFIRNDLDDIYYNSEKTLVLKAWGRIVGKESNDTKTVEKLSILNFLLSVMNYEHASADTTTKNIHRDFISFYEYYHLSVLNKKKIKRQRELTFTPSFFLGSSVSPNGKSKRTSNRKLTSSVYEGGFNKDSLQDKWRKLRSKNLKNSDWTFKPKIKRGPKLLLLDQSFNDNDSVSSEYVRFSEDPGSKTSHRTEILYNFSKMAQEKLSQFSKENIDTQLSFSDHSETPNPINSRQDDARDIGKGKGVTQLIAKLRKAKRKENETSAKDHRAYEIAIKSAGSHSPRSIGSLNNN